MSRIDATGAHIVRGLYYLETKRPVDPKACVMVQSWPDIAPSNPLLLNAVRLHDLSPDKRERSVGEAFSYCVGLGFGNSVLGMMLYGYYFWIALIGEPPDDLVDGQPLSPTEKPKPAEHAGLESE